MLLQVLDCSVLHCTGERCITPLPFPQLPPLLRHPPAPLSPNFSTHTPPSRPRAPLTSGLTALMSCLIWLQDTCDTCEAPSTNTRVVPPGAEGLDASNSAVALRRSAGSCCREVMGSPGAAAAMAGGRGCCTSCCSCCCSVAAVACGVLQREGAKEKQGGATIGRAGLVGKMQGAHVPEP